LEQQERAVMQAEIHTNEHQLVTEFIARMNGAGDGPAAREAYREGFRRLRSQLEMYPVSGRHASVIFESAARTARNLAASCLPLGIAVAMHLYPLCVLQCMPLPLLSVARFQRAMLLRTIRNRSLILANAGSDRTRGADQSPVARQDAEGIRIDGTFEYMSLATVADVVLFKALRGGNYFCRSRCLSSESYPTSPLRSHREEHPERIPRGSIDQRPWESRSEGTASEARRHVAKGLPRALATIRPSCLTQPSACATLAMSPGVSHVR